METKFNNPCKITLYILNNLFLNWNLTHILLKYWIITSRYWYKFKYALVFISPKTKHSLSRVPTEPDCTYLVSNCPPVSQYMCT